MASAPSTPCALNPPISVSRSKTDSFVFELRADSGPDAALKAFDSLALRMTSILFLSRRRRSSWCFFCKVHSQVACLQGASPSGQGEQPACELRPRCPRHLSCWDLRVEGGASAAWSSHVLCQRMTTISTATRDSHDEGCAKAEQMAAAPSKGMRTLSAQAASPTMMSFQLWLQRRWCSLHIIGRIYGHRIADCSSSLTCSECTWSSGHPWSELACRA